MFFFRLVSLNSSFPNSSSVLLFCMNISIGIHSGICCTAKSLQSYNLVRITGCLHPLLLIWIHLFVMLRCANHFIWLPWHSHCVIWVHLFVHLGCFNYFIWLPWHSHCVIWVHLFLCLGYLHHIWLLWHSHCSISSSKTNTSSWSLLRRS